MSPTTQQILNELHQIRVEIKSIKEYMLNENRFQGPKFSKIPSPVITLDEMFRKSKTLKKHDLTPKELDLLL